MLSPVHISRLGLSICFGNRDLQLSPGPAQRSALQSRAAQSWGTTKTPRRSPRLNQPGRLGVGLEGARQEQVGLQLSS